MHHLANGACAIILPLPKTDCHSAWLGFAGGTHIDILLVDAPAIMGFRIETHTVKFAKLKNSSDHRDSFVGLVAAPQRCLLTRLFPSADDHHHSLPRVPASCAYDGRHRGANGACAIILPLPKSEYRSACFGFAGGTHIDTLKLDARAIMGFRIERDTVKFAKYKGAETITTALWASVAAPQRCLLTRWFSSC
ncbi:hypothetical protein MRX96_033996 [Rhipicephalus microplus]